MDHLDYVKSHESAGLNEQMLKLHPGGAILEIGGGVKNRFAKVLNRPPVINIEWDDDLEPCGDVVLRLDLNRLDNGLLDPQIREASDPGGGIGTIIMSHSLPYLEPASIRSIIASSVENIRENGNIWIFHKPPAGQYAAIRNTQADDAALKKRIKDKYTNIINAIHGGAEEARSAGIVQSASVTPYAREDAKNELDAVRGTKLLQKFYDGIDQKKIVYSANPDMREEPLKGAEKIGPATYRMWHMDQHLKLISKNRSGAIEALWDSFPKRIESIFEKNKAWLKMHKKKSR